jgi:hypothetical protein
MADQPQDKKIIVDEDWKSQVEAEREAGQPDVEEAAAADSPQDVPLPSASLETLIGSLATQAMVSLGIFPNPMTNKPERMLHQAKHLIDMLAVVQEKTEGNRTAEETELLDDTLHQLRMAFVAMSQAEGPSAE